MDGQHDHVQQDRPADRVGQQAIAWRRIDRQERQRHRQGFARVHDLRPRARRTLFRHDLYFGDRGCDGYDAECPWHNSTVYSRRPGSIARDPQIMHFDGRREQVDGSDPEADAGIRRGRRQVGDPQI